MITCDEAVRRLWAYLDNDLDDADSADVDRHLLLCRRCCGEAEFVSALRDLLRSTAACDLPSDVERHLTGFLEGLEQEA